MGPRAPRRHPAGDAALTTEAAPPETPPPAPSLPDVARTASPDGAEILFPERARYHEVVAAHRRAGFEMLADLTAVDYLIHHGRALPAGVAPERFELVANLLSVDQRRRVRIRLQVPEADPVVASLWDLYRGAEAMEREVYDMYGIAFTGHPDLTRILMPEDWEGHPLRKDFGVGRVPVQFKEAPGPR